MILKILSWNIWQGKHLSDVVALFKKEQPDIIGLQEVIDVTDWSQIVPRINFRGLKVLGFVFKFTRAAENLSLFNLSSSEDCNRLTHSSPL